MSIDYPSMYIYHYVFQDLTIWYRAEIVLIRLCMALLRVFGKSSFILIGKFLLLQMQPGPSDLYHQCLIKRNMKTATFYLYLASSPCKFTLNGLFLHSRKKEAHYLLSTHRDVPLQWSKSIALSVGKEALLIYIVSQIGLMHTQTYVFIHVDHNDRYFLMFKNTQDSIDIV